MIDRAAQLDWATYEARNAAARREYAANPNPCRDWCPDCIRPRGTTKDCARCKDVRRLRAYRAKRKKP